MLNILCKYENKIKVRFFLFRFLVNTCFMCNYGKCARLGCYNLYFEALKSLLLKTAPYFFPIFAENIMLLSLNIKLIPLGASISKYKKSAFPMWLYEGESYEPP